MAYNYKEVLYSSKKHPILEYIFNKYNPHGTSTENIIFSLKDISEAYKYCEIAEPASISNTILDLTRKKGKISSRLPVSIYSLGFDLRKKTGGNLAGEFVYVGIGNELQSWLEWDLNIPQEQILNIDSTKIPDLVLKFLRNDEGALFSVIDYCDIFNKVFPNHNIVRVQNPLKWQPNEIDGFYVGNLNDKIYLFPTEAKALTTGDDINLEQMLGAISMMHQRYNDENILICPLAVKMIKNGILIAEFENLSAGSTINSLILKKQYKIQFNPNLINW